MCSNKLCFAELCIIYQRMINLTYYVFITNDYVLYFSCNHLTILYDEAVWCGFLKSTKINFLLYIQKLFFK